MSEEFKIDNKKIEKTIEKIHKIINKTDLNIAEIIIAYGNLGYHLGASMAGFEDQGPSLPVLQQEYYRNPTVDVGLMLQGLLITSWEDSFKVKPQLSVFAAENQKKKEKKVQK